MQEYYAENAIIFGSFALLLLYHLHLVRQIRRKPLTTALGLSHDLRRKWVVSVLQSKPDVMPVQTMRNWIMAASFLASTAVLLSLGMLHVGFIMPANQDITQAISFFNPKNITFWQLRWLAVAADLFFAFFCFSLAIRHWNHASFMINTRLEDKHHTPQAITAVINRGSLYNMLGMRGYYLSIPFMLWLMGSVWLLAGTILLVVILYHFDRTI
ncbi:MAG: DUF599 domain-containing protein [Myxococcales bacterium]|nr:MAG: DUF599 domain-containing protein [Myxococcales bacterium]